MRRRISLAMVGFFMVVASQAGDRSAFAQSCPADITGNGTVNVQDLLAIIGGWGPCPALPNPCPADIAPPSPNGDAIVNVQDLLAVIGAWGPCFATGACWLPSDECEVNSQSECTAAGGIGWVGGANCLDSDGDRIPDAFELNDCSDPAAAFVGTDPKLADTDGDGLSDGDELYGTTAGLDLPGLGCNPLRKNLLMEVDWFDDATGGAHSHRPGDTAVNMLVTAFANSPVANVCGGTGISLIVDYGQGGPYTGGNLIPGGDTVILWDEEFNIYKAANFAANRNGYFYYGLHAHRFNTLNNSSSGIAELAGDDHIISLGIQLSDSFVSKTMMHEFGHNLGLLHGGFESLNYKPNYNSVMNYRYSFPGVDSNCNAVGDGGLDYSHGVYITLNENALSEAAGVCGSTPVDWNLGGTINPGLIARNINCVANSSVPCGSISGACDGNVCDVIQDYDDWANVVFTGLSDADLAPPQIIICEPPGLNE